MIADMSLNATSWRRRRRFTTSLRPSQSSLHAPFLKCGLFACSALNARSNDCHVGLLCMTQRAQYRTQMWVRTLCVVVRTDFLCYPVHFQHKKLNSPWRCSRVPVGADPLRVTCSDNFHCADGDTFAIVSVVKPAGQRGGAEHTRFGRSATLAHLLLLEDGGTKAISLEA